MVTERDLKQLDMSLEELFEHILECKQTGLDTEARYLFKMFSEKQQERFFEYASDLVLQNDTEAVSELIHFKKYFNHE